MSEKEMARIDEHQSDYKPEAWKAYTMYELGGWVHLMSERASHRSGEKKLKDLTDAKNYLAMMSLKLRDTCTELEVDFDKL